MKRRTVTARAGSAHAMQPEAFGWLFDEPAPVTVERMGPIAIVPIRGALEQRASWCGAGYDEIVAAFAAACATDAHTIVLDIDSCGGVVAGCFAAVREMRRQAELAGKAVVAYARENARSAAYALATAADYIALPDTGTVGSVGVIGVVDDYTAAMAREGVRVTVLVSGARKADGNHMVETTPEAVATLQATIDTLAAVFFGLVADRRPLSAAQVKGLEAGVFLGQAAVDAGLADEVVSYVDLLARLSAEGPSIMTDEEKQAEEKSAAEAAEAEAENAEAAPASEAEDMPAEDEEDDVPAAVAARSHSSRDILAAVRSITGQSSPAAQVGALQALHAEAKRARKLAARVAKLEADGRKTAVAATVDAAIKAGKLSPAQRSWALATGEKNPEVLDGYLATAQRIAPAPAAAPAPLPASNDLTDADRKMAKAMGIPEATFAAQKLANARTH